MERRLAVQHDPPATQQKIDVVRAPDTGFRRYTICGPALWGCWTHWAGNHTEACLCSPEEREIWPDPFNHRWKGFLHVILDGTGRQYFLEISAAAANDLNNKVADRTNLRGYLIRVSREPETKRGAIQIVIERRPLTSAKLPEARDPVHVLEKLWKTKLPAGHHAA